MTEPDIPRVSAVVLAYKAEPWLRRGGEALLAAEKGTVEVVLVDNGCTNDDVEVLEQVPGVVVVRPGENLGFAGGCNAGAAAATGDYLALVNGDAIVEPTTMARLVEELAQPDVAIAGASIRLASDPRLLNAGGNPVHVLGISWAGRLNEPEDRTQPEEVVVASGACLMLETAVWRQLGGFDDKYFAYHEDTELSIRVWQTGRRVMYVPDAVAVHRYEFSRTAHKYYLIERNRMMFLATLWSWRALFVLSPALLGLEAAMLLLALKQGWFGYKVRADWWILRNLGHIARRRRQLRGERTVPDKVWMAKLTSVLDPPAVDLPAVTGPLNKIMTAHWSAARKLV